MWYNFLTEHRVKACVYVSSNLLINGAEGSPGPRPINFLFVVMTDYNW